MDKAKVIYILKRIGLMFMTLFIIMTMCFILVRLLPMSMPEGASAQQQETIQRRWEALGYNKPILVQYGIYLKNIITRWDFGTSWKLKVLEPASNLLLSRLAPTVLVNVYSLLFSIPIGILLGVYAAIRKNKWQDQIISILVMLFVSIPSYIYAFLMQYFLYYKWQLLPQVLYSLEDGGGSYFTFKMFTSMITPILALSFGEIAGLTRFVRAELTETLTSDYMLLARTKGLSRRQATYRHALRNAMVPVLPMLIGDFLSILGGSMIIEQIFSIPGVGQLYLYSIQQRDFDVFMMETIFYTFIGLAAGIIVDISYGFIDPRIRVGER
ncbi:MAG: ABC transporter permease [Bacilli bacterium]|nr:ABC transporter permease [Bacilli bacterium]